MEARPGVRGGGFAVNKKGALGYILTDLPDRFQKNREEF